MASDHPGALSRMHTRSHDGTGTQLWVVRNATGQLRNRLNTSLADSQPGSGLTSCSKQPTSRNYAAAHSRVVPIKSADATVKETDGTRWFRAEAGGGTTGSLSGWVREKEHPDVVLCSPWAWPGFVLMDTGTLQPKDLYGRLLDKTRQAQASERSQMESLGQSAEQSPLFDALCKAIDTDGKGNITPLELRAALGKPWLANALSRLAIKHHSEWAGPMDRWDAIDELIPEPRKQDWTKEKARIRELQFWDDVKGKSGFPTEPKVHHLHPVGFVENFYGRRIEITVEMLQQIFTSAPTSRLRQIAGEINESIEEYHLDTTLRLSHFFAQVREEIGNSASLTESLDYSPEGLINTFSYFRRNQEEATTYGRTRGSPADQEAIANRAYANRNGNGDVASGDGWRYRGRGLKMTTGRGNYQDLQDNYHLVWPDAAPQFVNDPDMLGTAEYAV